MPATAPHSRNVQAKAEKLIADGRCHPVATVPGKVWTGIIDGDSGRYLVTSLDPSVVRHLSAQTGAPAPVESCQCTGFEKTRQCAHTLAAFHLRVRSTPAEDLFAAVA